MTDIYKKLEEAIIAVVKDMRDEITNLEDPPTYFDFHVEVDGRAMDGDVEIAFIFDGGSYSKQTKGGRLRETFDEYLRRYGWQRANAPLCLPKVDEHEFDERREHNN